VLHLLVEPAESERANHQSGTVLRKRSGEREGSDAVSETLKPVAGYFRVSKARDDMRAPDIYTEQIEAYCRYRGLALSHIFSDVDFSGRRNSALPRPWGLGLASVGYPHRRDV
jgi:hypothetical protein